MFGSLWADAAAFLDPAFRSASRCSLHDAVLGKLQSYKSLAGRTPDEVANAVRSRTAELAKLGFSPVGCYNCGTLTQEPHRYMGYFCNRAMNDYASVCALLTTHNTARYLEFSTSFHEWNDTRDQHK